jgi:hypothetical protein
MRLVKVLTIFTERIHPTRKSTMRILRLGVRMKWTRGIHGSETYGTLNRPILGMMRSTREDLFWKKKKKKKKKKGAKCERLSSKKLRP